MPYRLTEEAVRDLVELATYGLEQFGEVQTRKYLTGRYLPSNSLLLEADGSD